jgi:hypothetical integral membrane protein (TIGR02206 family)
MGVVGVVIVRTGLTGDETIQRRLRWIMVGIFLLWEVEWQAWFIVTDQWTLQRQLPLHMCSIMIWVGIYALITKDERAYPFLYFFGIGASLQAVITPDATFDFPHVRFLNTMISHGLLVIVGFWILIVEKYRPTWRDVGIALVVLNLYAVVIYPINLSIEANYLYVVDKPATASLLDFFPKWPWYLLLIEGIAAALFAAMCWPFNRAVGAVQRVPEEAE